MVSEQLERRGILDPRVLRAVGKVPRHLFVDEALVGRAYGDHPLPIGDGQTISQPYMVALMTEALELHGHERVLEIGTGCGYQTAVLAEVCGKVFSVERLKSLADRATHRLDSLGYYNVLVRVADGSLGWKEEAPFDAILVAAAAPTIPQALIDQLAPKGRLIVPVGDIYTQSLRKGVRGEAGMRWSDLGGCVFVKLVGQQGWPNGS
ncbi:MAG: protein-L-isoaspartate(D-aspartate) O-methyltransferase [candidate division NC10 bacterium]|nr:protein-L-isoaspartate(D-aspartate) O-methyltransferase [candidate division NC10 bacterium]